MRSIPYFIYTKNFQGSKDFDIIETYDYEGTPRQYSHYIFKDVVSRYVMKNIPAFRDETFITSKNDYIIKLDLELAKINYPGGRYQETIMSTWPKLAEDLLKMKEFGKYIKASQKDPNAIIKNNQLKLKPEKERFEYIVNHVKTSYSWNDYRGIFTDETLPKFLNTKTGNYGNINLYLVGLLKAADIEAYPALISTRDNGKVKTGFPFLTGFNCIIAAAKINNEWILADGTCNICANDMIPIQCINEKGFVVKEDVVEWVDLTQKTISSIDENIQIEIIPDANEYKASLELILKRYEANSFRQNYKNDISKISKYWKNKDLTVVYESIQTHNYNDKDKPYIINLEAYEQLDWIEGDIFINPFLNEPVDKNPFIFEERHYPFDLVYPVRKTYNSVIILPPNYEINELPDNFSLDNEDVFIVFNYQFRKRYYTSNG